AVAQALARLGRAIDYLVTVVAEKFEKASAEQTPTAEARRHGDTERTGDLASDFGDSARFRPSSQALDFADAKLLEQRDFALSKVRALEEAFVVVSTQGEGDEEALEQALRSSAAYVAFVASATKASKVTEYLRTKKLPESRLVQLRAPAGLNIGAISPHEIAVSILAEIVKMQHAPQAEATKEAKPAQLLPVIATEDRDPICGMLVNSATARYKSEYRGKRFSFCCA